MKKLLLMVSIGIALVIPDICACQNDKILERIITIPDQTILEERFKNEGLAGFAQKDAVIKSLIMQKECDLHRLGSNIDISAKTTDNAIIEKILKCLLPDDTSAIQAVKWWIDELNSYEIQT
jgi:hypothetical protein